MSIALGVEKRPPLPKWTRPAKQQIDNQANHHRRQAHQRIGHRNRCAPLAKPPDRKPRAERQSNQRGSHQRRQADLQRAQRDFDRIGVKRDDQPECSLQSGPNVVHRSILLRGSVRTPFAS